MMEGCLNGIKWKGLESVEFKENEYCSTCKHCIRHLVGNSIYHFSPRYDCKVWGTWVLANNKCEYYEKNTD